MDFGAQGDPERVPALQSEEHDKVPASPRPGKRLHEQQFRSEVPDPRT